MQRHGGCEAVANVASFCLDHGSEGWEKGKNALFAPVINSNSDALDKEFESWLDSESILW